MSPVLTQMLNGDGFRFYRYEPDGGGEPVDLLSVTSIRTLCGESFQLVNWQLANLADAALGTMKRTVIGPRGGVKEVRSVWEYPSEFAQRYDATEGKQGEIDKLRKWLREQADEPRNIAAVRGTIVHEAIERNVAWDRIERPYVESAFASLSHRDRQKVKRAVNDEDVDFVRNSVRQYWDMRATVPMVLIAREVRVLNLTAGYAGTFDVLAWLLGEFDAAGDFHAYDKARVEDILRHVGKLVTAKAVQQYGGTVVLLDWKTSKGVHTDQVVQAHAYLAGEMAVSDDGRVDDRLTELLQAALYGGLVHVRPNRWGLHLFPFEPEAVRAFLGSVAFARFIAKHPKPDSIFTCNLGGISTEEDEEVDAA